MKPTAKLAFEEMKPIVLEVIRLMATCPLPKGEKTALHVYVFGLIAGSLFAQLEMEPTPANALKLGEVLAAALQKGMQ